MPHLCSTTDKFWLSLSWPDLMMWLFSLGHCRGDQQEIKNNSETYFHDIWSYYQTSSILVGLLHENGRLCLFLANCHCNLCVCYGSNPPGGIVVGDLTGGWGVGGWSETIHHRGVSSGWSNIWHSYELISDFDLLGPSVLLHVQFNWDHGQTWIR